MRLRLTRSDQHRVRRQSDPEAASRWVAQFQGQAGYDEAVASIIISAAGVNPRLAAEMAESSASNLDERTWNLIGAGWAAREPVAAAEWALARDDPVAKASVMSGAISSWRRSAPAQLQRWTLGLPRGAARDVVLNAIMLSPGLENLDYPTFIGAFSTEQEAQQSIIGTIERAATAPLEFRDMAFAEELLEYLTDPALRRSADEKIAAAR